MARPYRPRLLAISNRAIPKHIDKVPIYAGVHIGEIEDPANNQQAIEIDSVPSPYAQIHMTDYAFAAIIENPIGNSIYHQLVSDCLDVWELVFNWDNYIGLELDFLVWNKSNQLQLLQASSNNGHKLLSYALDLFWDSNQGFLGNLEEIYLITQAGHVFAGTSPLTGFFVGKNHRPKNLQSPNGRILFSNDFTTLKDRPQDFLCYLNDVHQANMPIFVTRMFNFHNLLQANLPQALGGSNSAPQPIEQTYSVITNQTGTSLKIFDTNFQVYKRASGISMDGSDFIGIFLKSVHRQNPPLLLTKRSAVGKKYSKSINLTDEIRNAIPIFLETPINERILPVGGFKYPFIVAGDFLDEFLIELPYEINTQFIPKDKIKTEGFTYDYPFKFLLPLKDCFFDYFSETELQIKFINKNNGNEIQVDLTLPTTGGEIIFSRTYSRSQMTNREDIRLDPKGTGAIISGSQMSIMIFPFLKVLQNNQQPLNEFNDFYRVGLINADGNKYELKFFGNDQSERVRQIDGVTEVKRSENSQYYKLRESFSRVKIILDNQSSAYIIPDWPLITINSGDQAYRVAIDFGTTNTHVVLQHGLNAPEPLGFDIKNLPVARLDEPLKNPNYYPNETSDLDMYEAPPTMQHPIGQPIFSILSNLQAVEFIPSLIHKTGKHRDYKFPIRTVLHRQDSAKSAPTIDILSTANIAFSHEKRVVNRDVNTAIFNLKWNQIDPLNQSYINVFFDELLYLIRTKILLQGGNPSITKLTTFYPLSMPKNSLRALNSQWSQSFNDICKPIKDNLPIHITESIAPFYYFNQGSVQQFGTIINIDIGGGTSDILISLNNQPTYATSIQFAGNSIFGGGQTNKFVESLTTLFNGIVSDIPINELGKRAKWNIWKGILENLNIQEQKANFFFSIPELNVAQSINQGDKYKLIFLLFFAALAFHTAKILKAKEPYIKSKNGSNFPSDICFSGNGSKFLYTLLYPNQFTEGNQAGILTLKHKEDFSKFITAIFKSVLLSNENCNEIRIHTLTNPKDATCFGGLQINNNQVLELKSGTILGEKISINEKEFMWDLDDSLEYQSISGQINVNNDPVNSCFHEFATLFFHLIKQREFHYTDVFGVKSSIKLEDVKNAFILDHQLAIGNGVQDRRKAGDQFLSETIFFYPVIAGINKIMQHQF